MDFVYDRVLTRENICNLKEEQKLIEKHISSKHNVVLYAPRNFGKTSLVKAITIPDFQKKHKDSFVYFVDLMGVKDMDSLIQRLKKALNASLKESFPLKYIIENISEYIKNLRPDISIDIEGGEPKVKVSTYNSKPELTISDIFKIINNISKKHNCLIVLDEFQDISFVNEAEALFRDVLQNWDIPVIILGSKKHILTHIFAKPNAPLSSFGHDVVIKNIDYAEFHQYMNERFELKKNRINLENSKILQDLMLRVPESINILGFELNYLFQNIDITENEIKLAINSILSSRQERFEFLMKFMSKAEETILKTIAKQGGIVTHPTSKNFLAMVNLTARTVSLNVNKLLDNGFLEVEDEHYRISDGLLCKYIQKFR
jgi:hypothetical protein